MQSLRPIFSLVGIIGPIIYCGWLVYYFINVSGSLQAVQDNGLGPTVLGLAIIGLIFFAVLIVVIFRLLAYPRSRRSNGRDGTDGPNQDGGFDADAVVARYMAQRAAEAASISSATPPPRDGGGPTRRSSFGRKIR